MKENAIEINDLCISYRGLKSYSIKKSLLHFRRNKVDEFQAIRHVSFNVRKENILAVLMDKALTSCLRSGNMGFINLTRVIGGECHAPIP